MSKKIAEGIDGLVLDVKTGSGAFMKTPERSRALAESLVAIGRASHVRTEALITAMHTPLGRAVGNALEVVECLESLKGGGPADLVELSVALAARMLVLGGVAGDRADAEARVREAIRSGAGLDRFRRIIEGQGGDPRVVDDYGRLPSAPERHVVTAPHAGYVARLDAELVGRAAVAAGRRPRPRGRSGRPRRGHPDPREARRRGRGGGPGARAALPGRGAPQRGAAARPAGSGGRPGAAGARAAHHRSHRRGHRRGGRERMIGRLQSLIGAALILAIAYALSSNRRAIRLRTIAWGLGLQVVFALIVLKTAIGQRVFTALGDLVTRLLGVHHRRARRSSSGRSATPASGAARDDGGARARWRAVRDDLRVPGAADDHLHRGAVRDPLLLRRDAVRRAAVRRR